MVPCSLGTAFLAEFCHGWCFNVLNISWLAREPDFSVPESSVIIYMEVPNFGTHQRSTTSLQHYDIWILAEYGCGVRLRLSPHTSLVILYAKVPMLNQLRNS